MVKKPELRILLRAKRRAISLEKRQDAMLAASRLLIKHPLFQQSESIACYLANDYEFDCEAIITAIWGAGKKCYLPVLFPEEKNLGFAEYQPSDSLHPNKYGILEPNHTKRIAAPDLDLVLIPLVGFDSQGYRLGMGGGYYDRTFQFLLTQKTRAKPYLIGLAFEDQQVNALPHDEWDVLLNGVLTEKHILFFTPIQPDFYFF